MKYPGLEQHSGKRKFYLMTKKTQNLAVKNNINNVKN